MQYCLIYEDSFGTCKIIVPRGQEWASFANAEDFIQQLHIIAVPNCVDFIACSIDMLPTDRTFREAWRKGTLESPIIVDFDKALAIHRERLFEACQDKMAQLREDLEIALEKDNLPEQVAIRRTMNILRTLHELNLTHCKTVDDIKRAIPRELFDVWHWYPPVP